jgi:hypothetical protein
MGLFLGLLFLLIMMGMFIMSIGFALMYRRDQSRKYARHDCLYFLTYGLVILVLQLLYYTSAVQYQPLLWIGVCFTFASSAYYRHCVRSRGVR